MLRPTSRPAGGFGLTIRFRDDPRSRGRPPNAVLVIAPVMHGLRCRCQERQRHPLTPDPAAHGCKLDHPSVLARKFAHVWADALRGKRARARRRRRTIACRPTRQREASPRRRPLSRESEVVTASKRQRRQRGDQSLLFQDRVVSSSRSSASSVASLSGEMWRAASLAMAQRLWLTTSMLCPSGSRTNAP